MSITEQIDLLKELKLSKNSLQKQYRCGIIDYIGFTNELTLIKSKERKIKEDLLQRVHVGRGGKLREINYHEDRGRWETKMPDGKKRTARDKDILYDKILEWYGIMPRDNKLSHIFELAVKEKERTENNNPQTIAHHRADYKRFITKEFGNRKFSRVSQQ
ncbi:MAG: hypothetical protein K5668_09800 [Lachnospiraceae bacterium]|nr:hypothetical protein [Lachnospiraceae bacterium]